MKNFLKTELFICIALAVLTLLCGIWFWHAIESGMERKNAFDARVKQGDELRLKVQQAQQAEIQKRQDLIKNDPEKAFPERQIEVKKIKWQHMVTWAEGELTVENRNRFPVKDLLVWCEFSGNSGTVMQTTTKTYYERLEPYQTKTFPQSGFGDFINEQAHDVKCDVRGATVIE